VGPIVIDIQAAINLDPGSCCKRQIARG
jgi:hypothetical protein